MPLKSVTTVLTMRQHCLKVRQQREVQSCCGPLVAKGMQHYSVFTLDCVMLS